MRIIIISLLIFTFLQGCCIILPLPEMPKVIIVEEKYCEKLR